MKIRRMLFVSVLSVLLLGVTSNVQAGWWNEFTSALGEVLTFVGKELKEDARLMWRGAEPGIYGALAYAKGDLAGAATQVVAVIGRVKEEYDGESNWASEMTGHNNIYTATVIAVSKGYSDYTGDDAAREGYEHIKMGVGIYELATTVKDIGGYKQVSIDKSTKSMMRYSGAIAKGKGPGTIIGQQRLDQFEKGIGGIIDGFKYIQDGLQIKDGKIEGQLPSNFAKVENGKYILTDEGNKIQMCIDPEVFDNLMKQCVADIAKDDGNYDGVLPVEAPGGRRNNGGKPVVTPVKPIEIYRE